MSYTPKALGPIALGMSNNGPLEVCVHRSKDPRETVVEKRTPIRTPVWRERSPRRGGAPPYRGYHLVATDEANKNKGFATRAAVSSRCLFF